MSATIDTTGLRTWQLGVISRLHRPPTDKLGIALAERGAADGTLNRRTYSLAAVDTMLNSGLLVVCPGNLRRLTLNPDVTEEQWDGVHVLYALQRSEPTSNDDLSDALKAFVHATTQTET